MGLSKKESIAKVKKELQKLAKDFNLKYKINVPIEFINKREYTLRRYIGGCPDASYNQFGLDSDKRIRHIDAFLESDIFHEELKEPGGLVISKEELERELHLSETIGNKLVREEMLKYYKRLHSKKTDRLVCLTEPKNEVEMDFVMRTVLKHEWIHVLLQNNDLFFQNIKYAYWPYDEGIAVYLQGFSENKIDFLKQRNSKLEMDRQILTKTRSFIKLFKDKRTPKNRKDALVNTYMNMANKA